MQPTEAAEIREDGAALEDASSVDGAGDAAPVPAPAPPQDVAGDETAEQSPVQDEQLAASAPAVSQPERSPEHDDLQAPEPEPKDLQALEPSSEQDGAQQQPESSKTPEGADVAEANEASGSVTAEHAPGGADNADNAVEPSLDPEQPARADVGESNGVNGYSAESPAEPEATISEPAAGEHSDHRNETAATTEEAANVPNNAADEPSGSHSENAATASITSSLRKEQMDSNVFVIQALESIMATKQGRKGQLKESLERAMTAVKSDKGVSARAILEPLKLACASGNTQLVITSLDCLGKLVSYSYFYDANPSPAEIPIMDDVVDTICTCFQGEGTDERVQLQIVKALLGAVLNENPNTAIHNSALLKSVRSTYNIFLLSRSTANQGVAQVTLAQMVHAVFDRIKRRHPSADDFAPDEHLDETSEDTAEASEKPSPEEAGESESVPVTGGQDAQAEGKLTLQELEQRQTFDQVKDERTEDEDEMDEQDVFIKDAFLVFRSFCKLSIKPVSIEQAADLRSEQMRSKLMTLYLVFIIFNKHMDVFLDDRVRLRSSRLKDGTPFIEACKQYICVSLSRNCLSPVPQVFDISCEIFWKVLSHLRTMFKREIEVFFIEIFFPILEMRNSSSLQKQILLNVLSRLCNEPKTVVELYLNYDCDRSFENLYERLLNILSKMASITTDIPVEVVAATSSIVPKGLDDMSLPPPLTTAALSLPQPEQPSQAVMEFRLKKQALDCMVAILSSLATWSNQGIRAHLVGEGDSSFTESASNAGDDSSKASGFTSPRGKSSNSLDVPSSSGTGSRTPSRMDDPSQFEALKQRKSTLQEGIRQFNAKPKRGLVYLREHGFLKSDDSREIAEFLFKTDGINKTVLGEYLGEGDEKNVEIMHAFIDILKFDKMKFTDALRQFLQTFRLPGESQKIDRFMLKFAERYIDGNPKAFANADTAYVLSYSVIMLNTDQHNPQVRNRMSKQDFINNNRGIDDGASLPDEYLSAIYDEIAHNEIVMKDEQEQAAMMGIVRTNGQGFASNISSALATVGRDLQREAYMAASEEMASKTEAILKQLLRSQKRGQGKTQLLNQYYVASHFEHVGPMFDVVWMPFLASLSSPLQGCDDENVIQVCLAGFRDAVRIACLFDLELARNAFVSTLGHYTMLENLPEMKFKNVEVIRALLDIAVSEGNGLHGSWKEVLTRVSQLERLQLLSEGVDESLVPDVSRAKIHSSRASIDSNMARNSFQYTRYQTGARSASSMSFSKEVADAARTREIVLQMDRLFTQSAHLSGVAIVDFVKALCAVSVEEIQSSETAEEPRLYSLQKLVEISYYNMSRIRMEWSNIWEVLGEHFNRIALYPSHKVSFTALDSLRQLAMHFMDLDELPHFKFQKDFLRPFEYIMNSNAPVSAKEMTLRCILQMIQAKSNRIRSGWRTMFNILASGARSNNESINVLAFNTSKSIIRNNLGDVVIQGSFADITVSLSEFAKNKRFQKSALQAVQTLKGLVAVMLKNENSPLCENYQGKPTDSSDDVMLKFWYPILFAFHDITMNGDDLEVRSKALSSLFSTLETYGSQYPSEFWDIICRQLLFPMFTMLKSNTQTSRFGSQDDLTMWLSTTMVQAIRDMVKLFTYFFELLERMFDGMLELIVTCFCQESDALAKIGASCLQVFVVQNASKFSPEQWQKLISAFSRLFADTTASQLFKYKNLPQSDSGSAVNEAQTGEQIKEDLAVGLEQQKAVSPGPSVGMKSASGSKRRDFQPLIVKCVLQLLLLDSVNDIFRNQDVLQFIPNEDLLELMGSVLNSYKFAKSFNDDIELRTNLWNLGFMKQLPNLLRQETVSASTYVAIMLQMYQSKDTKASDKADIEERLIPLCHSVLASFATLDQESQSRNITSWRPVVNLIVQGFTSLPDEDFLKHCSTFYALAIELLKSQGTDLEMRKLLAQFFAKTGALKLKAV